MTNIKERKAFDAIDVLTYRTQSSSSAIYLWLGIFSVSKETKKAVFISTFLSMNHHQLCAKLCTFGSTGSRTLSTLHGALVFVSIQKQFFAVSSCPDCAKGMCKRNHSKIDHKRCHDSLQQFVNTSQYDDLKTLPNRKWQWRHNISPVWNRSHIVGTQNQYRWKTTFPKVTC